MATYQQLFGAEVCKCGKRGQYVISKNGKIIGYACKEHRETK